MSAYPALQHAISELLLFQNCNFTFLIARKIATFEHVVVNFVPNCLLYSCLWFAWFQG